MFKKLELSNRRKKSLTYSLFILLVITVFLLGYFFYFLPGNRETIHKNGFLILRTIAENIQEKNEGRINYYNNLVNNNRKNTDEIRGLVKENDIEATVQYLKTKNSTSNQRLKSSPGNSDSTQTSFSFQKKNIVYSLENKYNNDSIVFSEPATRFLQSILVTQRSELFQYYALAKVSADGSQLLYYDSAFGIRSDIKLDSLLPGNAQKYLTGIRDINSQDFNHKMFYYPFEMDTLQLVLCGFVRTEPYTSAIRKVPFGFVYPLAIIFILLLVFMPVLKFYIMDSNEQVRVKDVALFSLSIFVGAAMLTLIIIQYLLWKGQEERVKNNLQNLSAQIGHSFSRELSEVYRKIASIDSFRVSDSVFFKTQKATNINYSDRVREYINKANRNREDYYFFDRISWVDSNGNQVIKAEMHGEPVFTNVQERQYYKAIKDNAPFFLQDASGKVKKFGWEPIYSWTNAEFNISMSKQTDSYIAAIAAKMYSVVGAIMPAGYSFCIIDGNGTVQLHSDVNRNLRENFFDKAQPSNDLKGMVAARQEGYFNDIAMYGKWHMMGLTPVKGLPYTIVTFYDKGYIVPVNMRILIFALLFFSVSVLMCFILWIVLTRVAFKHPFIFSPMDFLKWLTPHKKEAGYYFHGFMFLTAYVVLFIAFIWLYKSYNVSNYTIFSLVLLTPLNVICVLFSIRVAFSHCKDELEAKQLNRLRRKAFIASTTHLLISIIFFSQSRSVGYPINITFFLFQGLFNGWMWFYYLRDKKSSFFQYNLMNNYRIGYNWMAALLIICLSVLPAAFYTWYAHNQEIIQAVKKQQLYLANDIKQRSSTLINRKGYNDTLLIPNDYYEQLIYKKGIYSIYRDNIEYETGTAKMGGDKDDQYNGKRNIGSFERFYFDVADKVSTPYYDPGLLPSLKDNAADSNWYWQNNDTAFNMWYHQALQTRDTALQAEKWLHISSVMPDRFLFFKGGRSVILIFVIALLIYALYRWLTVNTESLFLMKYMETAGEVGNIADTGVIADYFASSTCLEKDKEWHVNDWKDQKNYTVYTNEETLNLYEKEILGRVRKGKSLYDYIWNKCTEKEQYLLYDFAKDGLINYKNTNEIYDLIAKGIFLIPDDKLKLFSATFRAYLITKKDTEEITVLHKKFKRNAAWQSFQGPFVLLLIGVACIIFFTQEAMFQKLIALVGGAATLITLLPKLMSGAGNNPEAKES